MRAERPVELVHDGVEDEIAEQRVARGAEDLRRHIAAGGEHEAEQETGEQTGQRERQRDLLEGLPAGAAEGAGSRDQVAVDALEADIDVEDHIGEQEVHHPHDHRALGVEHADRLIDEAELASA